MSLAILPQGQVSGSRKDSNFTLLRAEQAPTSVEQSESFSKSEGSQKLSTGYVAADMVVSNRLSALSLMNLDLVYDTLTKNDLIEIIKEQRKQQTKNEWKMKALEEYIDNLLVKVLDSNPDLCAKCDAAWGAVRLTI